MVDSWVCPNDRQLALRAKLSAGWSIHTSRLNTYKKANYQLSAEEQEQIESVVRRSDMMDQLEMERIGKLVEKVDNMKKNAIGNGSSQCVLCGDEFGILGASPTNCDDCHKAVCSKCGVDSVNSQHNPLWLCKICSEKRELWKRSGAWFFKGLPNYVVPSSRKKQDHAGSSGHDHYNLRSGGKLRLDVRLGNKANPKNYQTWSWRGQNYGDSSDFDSDSSDSDTGLSFTGKRSTSSNASASTQPFSDTSEQSHHLKD